jgi:hypothetical protein
MTRNLTVALSALALTGVVGLPALAADEAEDAERQELRIEFDAPPQVEVRVDAMDELDPAGADAEQELFSGTYTGTVAGDDALLAGTSVVCEFEGIAAPGRAFSCGFTTVEDVAGRCLFTDEDGDSAVAEWSCRTGAMMTADARCEGRIDWIEGTGRFAGITGEGKFHSDLFLQPGDGYARWMGNWRIRTLADRTD